MRRMAETRAVHPYTAAVFDMPEEHLKRQHTCAITATC
jgi:hypothetical protein